jgi:hypothetical protein
MQGIVAVAGGMLCEGVQYRGANCETYAWKVSQAQSTHGGDDGGTGIALTAEFRSLADDRRCHIVGTDVNVPNGLNRNPRPVIPPVAWNLTMPRFPAVSAS